jgi:membrane protease YdiL (CAAX protease family)
MSASFVRRDRFFVRAMLFELGLGAVALAAGWIVGHDPLRPPAGNPLSENLSVVHNVVWGICAAVPMMAGLLLLDRFPVGPIRSLQRLSRNFLVPLFAEQTYWQLFLLSAAAGVGEELLFRGLLQGGLAGWLSGPQGPAAACVIASLVFGVCHWLSTTYAVLATLVGLYLGGIYAATGSLIAPATAHGLYDFLALVYLVKWGQGEARRLD